MIKIVGSESCEYDCSSRLNVPGTIWKEISLLKSLFFMCLDTANPAKSG